MNNMNWKEFKTYIDSELRKAGLDETAILHRVDLTWPSTVDCEVEVHEEQGEKFVSITTEL